MGPRLREEDGFWCSGRKKWVTDVDFLTTPSFSNLFFP